MVEIQFSFLSVLASVEIALGALGDNTNYIICFNEIGMLLID